MEWTKDIHTLLAFDTWIVNQSHDLSEFMGHIMPQLDKNDSVLLFMTFGKFSHMYERHRKANPTEDLALSLHRVMNTLMEEETTRILFARLAQNAANGVVKQ